MNSLNIRDVIEIPAVKPNLVVKVGEINSEQKRQAHVRDYVITDSIAKELESLVKSIADSAQSGFEGLGIWVDGSFGSGKSHFSTFLGMLLTNEKAAWAKDHFVIQKLAAYRAILEKYPVFVLPVNALDVPDSLKRNIFTAVNKQLELLGHETVELSSAKQIIRSFEENAESEKAFWNLLFNRSLTVISREEYNEAKENDPDALALEIREHVFRGAQRAMDLYEEMPEGIRKITAHLKALGFYAMVVLLDEITLFLQGKGEETTSRSLAELNRLLEHENAAIPVWAIVSRHLALEDLVGTQRMEHLHGRFQKRVEMQDVDLYEVCSKRVLRRKNGSEELEAALENNIKLLPQAQLRVLGELYGGQPQLRRALEKLYPFHPTIIDTLVAVTHRLSRERTAISVMYDMLFDYSDKPVGEWIPYAESFDYLFSEGEQALSGHPELLAAWQIIRDKTEPNLSAFFNDTLIDKAQIIACTLVLGQLTDRSLRLCDILTPEVISALNASILNRGIPFIVEQEMTEILSTLVERIPNFQRRGSGGYGVELSIGPDPDRALDELETVSLADERRKAILKLESDIFNVSDADGRRDNYKITWRGTDRRGLIRAVEPQAISDSDLVIPAGREYLLIIGFPNPSATALDTLSLKQDKELRAIWQPASLPQDAWDRIEKLAKINWALESSAGRASVEGRYGREDVERLRDQWRRTRDIISERLAADFKEAYLNGTITSSVNINGQPTGATPRDAMDDLISRMFQRRFVQHPEFGVTVTAQALDQLYRAILQNPNPINEDDGQHYSHAFSIGKPLEIYRQQGNSLAFDLTNANRLKVIADKIQERGRGQIKWLKEQMYNEFGLQGYVVEFLLKLLIAFGDYRAQRGEEAVIFNDLASIALKDEMFLARAQLVQQAEWHQFLNLRESFSLPQFEGELTSHTQDKAWGDFKNAATKAHEALQRLNNSLSEATKRLDVSLEKGAIPDAMSWLKYLSAIKELSQKDTADAIKGVLKLEKPRKSISDARKQVQDKLDLLGDSELKGLVQKIPQKGREEAKTRIEYFVSGQANLDETKNRLREIEEKYRIKPTVEETKPTTKKIEFRVSKSKLLEAFKDELGDKVQSLENYEREELVVEIRFSP